MTKKRNFHPLFKGLLTAGLVSLSVSLSTAVLASGYQLSNQIFSSAVADGDSGASNAAWAGDASTSYTNPAGMVRIPNPQLIGGADWLDIVTKFRGTNTWTINTPALPPYAKLFVESGDADGGVIRTLPFFHFVSPIMHSRVSFGLSVVPIFGLATYYPSNSLLRYNTTRSELRVVDFTPSLAIKINDCWSIGLGADFADAFLVYRARGGIPTFGPFPFSHDFGSRNTLNALGFGGHAGLMYQMNPGTRFGLTYRSRIFMDMKGRSTLTFPYGAITHDNLQSNLILPAYTSFGGYHDFNPCWAIDATVNYTQWSNINNGNQIIHGIFVPNAFLMPVDTTVSIAWHYKNTWGASLGGIFRPNPCWTLRAGLLFDESPIKGDQRLPVIPDNNRWGPAIGAHWQAIKQVGFDIGWSHFFLPDSGLHAPTTIGPQTSIPNGVSKTHADVIGAQLVWDMV